VAARPVEGARGAARVAAAALVLAAGLIAAVLQRLPARADATQTPTPMPAATASAPALAASPTPLGTPTIPPPSTPAPVFITPTPSAQDFPRTNGAPAPMETEIPAAQESGAPQASPVPLPSGIARVTADQLYGNNSPTGGFTAYGHVKLEYADAVVTADQAVYDANTRILRATGHVLLAESDGDTATASALEYHSDSDRVEMFDVAGSTAAIYFQGQQIQGRLYYKGKEAILDPDGHTIVENGWITTCDPSHAAYHIRGREIEIRPHDRLIAHGSALYLGDVLVAALGVLVLPLTETAARQTNQFAPRIGYNSAYGFFIRNFINFYRGPNWYGTYHVDFYQKVGIGLGADLFFSRADGRGGGELSVYNLNNNSMQQQLTGTRNTTQATLNMQRMFSSHLQASLAFSYSGQSAIITALPTTTSTNVSVTHTGARSTTTYAVTDTASGPSHTFGGIFQHTIAFSPFFSQSIGLNLTDSTNPGAFSRAVGFNADTHVTARAFDADLVISTNHGLDTTNSTPTSPSTTTPVIGIQRIPELTVRAHPFQVTNLRLPIALTFIDGNYNDGYDNIETSRLQFNAQVGPGIVRIGNDALFNGTVNLLQDAYGTGDLQGAIGYQMTLQNFFAHHADNTLIYTAQSVRGYTPMPSLDRMTGANQIGEVLNVYNGSWYRFTASTSYNFQIKQLSTVNYQLNVSPNPYAYVSLGTSYNPGLGYSPMVIQLATPLSRADFLQFSGDYDFGAHGLQGQNWFLSHIVGNCYVVQVAYHQPLKEVDVSLGLLAFPNQIATFGINNNGPIIAQGFGD
jgi:hypothetical protein